MNTNTKTEQKMQKKNSNCLIVKDGSDLQEAEAGGESKVRGEKYIFLFVLTPFLPFLNLILVNYIDPIRVIFTFLNGLTLDWHLLYHTKTTKRKHRHMINDPKEKNV